MPDLEGHGTAWSRCYQYRREGGWSSERNCPIRLRGYSELVMERVPDKMRKAIDSALKRGYRLSNKDDFTNVLTLIQMYNPIHPDIPIGYVGKTRFNVYAPKDEAIDMHKSLQGLSAVDDKFDGKSVRIAHGAGYSEVYVREWIEAGGKGSANQPQLKASFTHARAVINTYMEKDAAVREQVAHWCAADDCTIRIPFDSHREKD